MGRAGGQNRFTMADGENLSIKFRQMVKRGLMLLGIEHKAWPDSHKFGRRDNGIAREENAALGPIKGEMSR